MPKSLRLRTFKTLEVVRLIDEADHLFACEGQPLRALERIDRALRIDRENVDALILRGQIFVALDRSRDAFNCFDGALFIDPKSSAALVERARALYALRHQYKRALRDVKRSLAYAGRNRWIRTDALRLQGHILEALGRDRDAIACYRAALQVNPRDAETRTALGDSLLLVGDPARAVQQFDYALRELGRQKPRDELSLGFTLSSKAEALNALGKGLEALRVVAYGLRQVKKGVAREALQSVRRQVLVQLTKGRRSRVTK
jgi:tetratricopeptide (TPR) repeat protein